ncbi:MAG: hypothetical protein LBU86_05835 [Oscillospiraceae bacterium]|nr:hypothetical protein [Oscillospiraceae bacterium]
MTRKTSAAVTTACLGLAAGATAYMMSNNKAVRTKTKLLRRNTGKALRQMGDFIDNVSYMMK